MVTSLLSKELSGYFLLMFHSFFGRIESFNFFLDLLTFTNFEIEACTITLCTIMVLNLISLPDTLLVQNRSIRFICCFWKKPEHAAQITESVEKKPIVLFQVPIGTIYLALDGKLYNITYFCYAQRLQTP